MAIAKIVHSGLAALAAVSVSLASTDLRPVSEHAGSHAFPEACRPEGRETRTMQLGSDPFVDDPSGAAKRAMASAIEPMVAGMIAGLMAGDGDAAYLCAMISHAQGAIALARIQIQVGRDQAAIDLARKFIMLKSNEITSLTRQLQQARI